ncbi:MAG: response regulator, partial [Desulfuromonadaceae bacterium]|nr:response regulator [Desulfuromonadaceae bacterium]
TGVLSLSSRGRDGSVFFRQGLVVRATSSANQLSLGELLVHKGIIDLPLLRCALAYQQEIDFSERLGIVLVHKFAVAQEAVDEVVREQIEQIVISLFSWTDGTFSFEIKKSVELIDGNMVDPLQFMLDQGLNPQFLALEGSRIYDENLRKSTFGGTERDDEPCEDTLDIVLDLLDSVKAQKASLPAELHQIVVVDDDGPTLRAITDGLIRHGFTVHAMTRSEDALIKVDSLHRSGGKPAVLIDLVMPKMDGSGQLGGVELMELLHGNFKGLQLIIMADQRHPAAETRIRELGYSLVSKPLQADIGTSAALAGFIADITHTIYHASGSCADAAQGGSFPECRLHREGAP